VQQCGSAAQAANALKKIAPSTVLKGSPPVTSAYSRISPCGHEVDPPIAHRQTARDGIRCEALIQSLIPEPRGEDVLRQALWSCNSPIYRSTKSVNAWPCCALGLRQLWQRGR
jgi:hypothetical protein